MQEPNQSNEEQESDLNQAWSYIFSKTKEIDPRVGQFDIDTEMVFELTRLLADRNATQITKDKLELAQIFLRDSRDDLESSLLLYRGGQFARSVFHIQQAVEKACKSFGLAVGTLDTSDLKSPIGHDSPQVFLHLLSEPIMGHFLAILSSYDGQDAVARVIEAKNTVKTKRSELMLIQDNNLKALLTLVHSVRETIIPQMRSRLSQLQSIIQVVYSETTIDIEAITCYIHSALTLYVLAVITYAHEQTSRFSDVGTLYQ